MFGIAGASGSGKTFSALMLAKGIANGTGKIAVIDTEAGRALHYAPKPGEKGDGIRTFDFLHIDFPPPFTPERYIEAIRAAEGAGATVIVIDSMSHEWDGEGGCADMADADPSWKTPKKRHKRMMARLIQTRTHLIFCLRAQEKVKFVKNPKTGKNDIVPMGFMPICEKSFMFELSGSMTMHPESPGQPRYDLPHKLNDDLRGIFAEGDRVGPDAGKRLRLWAESGEDRPPVDRVAEGVRELIERIQDADSMAALEAITADPEVMKRREWLAQKRIDLAARVTDAVNAALDALNSEEETRQEDAA
nr:AAA family ATPase [Pararoseomonas indoligenes]